EEVEYTSNGVVSKRILEREKGYITLFSFDKGQRLNEHSAFYDALIQVVEGEGRFTIDNVVHDLKAGDSIILPANVPHAVDAIERFKMIIIMIKD
ncbi:MAG: cupin domain-containing protein, partial [Bacteroidota bacterium]